MKPIVKILATALFVVAIAGTPILAQAVTIDYDHSVNFLKLKTYTWGSIHATDPGVEDRISIAVNRDMSARYMNLAGKNAEVTVTAVDASQNQQEYSDFYAGLNNLAWQRPWGSGGFLDTEATLQDVPLNTLIIDMYDTKTQKLLWRGMVNVPLSGSEDKKDDTIDKAVTQLIGKYPPKYSK